MKKTSKSLSFDEVKHIARLAKLNLSNYQITQFASELTLVLDYVSKIQLVNTKGVIETSQVTGLENVLREDIVDKNRLLSQEDTLLHAKRSYKGYFVVDAIFEE